MISSPYRVPSNRLQRRNVIQINADPKVDQEIEDMASLWNWLINTAVFMVVGAVLIWGVAELCLWIRHFGAHVAARLLS